MRATSPNKDGRRKEDFSVGNPFDRFKWSGTQFQKLLQAEAINALWTKLKQLYGVGAAPFLIDRGFPEEVRRPHSPPPPPLSLSLSLCPSHGNQPLSSCTSALSCIA